MCLCLVADEGPRLELHSPNEVEPKTDRVGANCCCQRIDSTACTIDLEVFLPCCGLVCLHVFSRTVAAVDTKRGYVGMCNGRSAQQESRAVLTKNSMFTAGA